MSREEFEARKAELRRKRELEQRVNNRDQAKDLGNGDIFLKEKRKLNLANSPATTPAELNPDKNDNMGKSMHAKADGNSLSPGLIGRRRHERREDTQSREHHSIDSKVERMSKDAGDNQGIQKGVDESGRPEKKPKASVFSRIIFPAERPKRSMTEKHSDNIDSEGDGNAFGAGSRNRKVFARTDRLGSERHSVSVESIDASKYNKAHSRDSGNLMNGRKINYEEDWPRPTNKVVNKYKTKDDTDGTDEDADEQNFKRRDHSKDGGHRSVRVNRDWVGLNKA